MNARKMIDMLHGDTHEVYLKLVNPRRESDHLTEVREFRSQSFIEARYALVCGCNVIFDSRVWKQCPRCGVEADIGAVRIFA